MRYLITIPAGARRISTTAFAAEGAFVQHLRELKAALGNRCEQMIVVMGRMDSTDWKNNKSSMIAVNELDENIKLEEIPEYSFGNIRFVLSCHRLLAKIVRLVRECDFVHSHFSYDLYRPVGALFCAIGRMFGRRVIAVSDIDLRRDAEMKYQLGTWGKRTYIICKYIYDPIRSLLMHGYIRCVDLMLFKELQQVRDYGRGADHVRLFLDPNFASENIIDNQRLEHKLTRLRDCAQPLRLLYFGRLVPYKGVDNMLNAVAITHKSGARVTFDIMGSGDQEQALRMLTRELGIEALVRWITPRPYGPSFFEVLHEHDVLLACPLSGDTPRSSWDALASAMPLVAFDTPFYVSMAEYSKAVELTPWPETEPFAKKLIELANNKRSLIPMASNAVRTARENTGEDWLNKRVEWVNELIDGKSEN